MLLSHTSGLRDPSDLLVSKVGLSLASVLTPEPGLGIPDTGLGLAFPDPLNPPSGCPFHPRCAQRLAQCDSVAPVLSQDPQGLVACHLTTIPIKPEPAVAAGIAVRSVV